MKSTLLQKHTRRFFVKLAFHLIGPALKNKKDCLNDHDFYSMEPLTNIPYDNFFSYKDSKDFIYGFELSSLINYIKINKKREITNPYNRGSMKHIIPKIKQLKRLHKIINKQENQKKVTKIFKFLQIIIFVIEHYLLVIHLIIPKC